MRFYSRVMSMSSKVGMGRMSTLSTNSDCLYPALDIDEIFGISYCSHLTLTHSLIHSFTHSLTHSLSHSLIHSHTHTLTLTLTHSLTQTCPHPFTHIKPHMISFSHLPPLVRLLLNLLRTYPQISTASLAKNPIHLSKFDNGGEKPTPAQRHHQIAHHFSSGGSIGGSWEP